MKFEVLMNHLSDDIDILNKKEQELRKRFIVKGLTYEQIKERLVYQLLLCSLNDLFSELALTNYDENDYADYDDFKFKNKVRFGIPNFLLETNKSWHKEKEILDGLLEYYQEKLDSKCSDYNKCTKMNAPYLIKKNEERNIKSIALLLNGINVLRESLENIIDYLTVRQNTVLKKTKEEVEASNSKNQTVSHKLTPEERLLKAIFGEPIEE